MVCIDYSERPPLILTLCDQAERTIDSSAGRMDSDLASGTRRFAAPVASQPGFSFDPEFRVLGACGYHGVTFRAGVVVDTLNEFFKRSMRPTFDGRC